MDKDKIVLQYLGGYGIKRLASIHGISTTTIARLLKKTGHYRGNAGRDCAKGRSKELDRAKSYWNDMDRLWAKAAMLKETEGDRQKKRDAAMARYYADHERNKVRRAKTAKERYWRIKNTGAYKIRATLRNTVSRIARRYMQGKHWKTIRYLGCTIDEARAHIESMFQKGMTWENHGEAWEIDHIIPLAAFDLSDPVQQLRASNILNLKPEWKGYNRTKGDTVIEGSQVCLGL